MKAIVYPSKKKIYIVPNRLANCVIKVWEVLDADEKLTKEELVEFLALKEKFNEELEKCKSYPIDKILDGDYL